MPDLVRPDDRRRPVSWLRWRLHSRHLRVGILLLAALAVAVAGRGGTGGATGPSVTIWVARHELAVGTTITDADVARRDLPAAVLAGRPVPSPTGRVVVATVLAGEPLVAERLGPEGLHGVAALLAADERAVAVPDLATLPPVEVGDAVDLVLERDDPLQGPVTEVLAGARVLALGDDGVTLAVPGADAGRAALAAGRGQVAVVVSGRR